MANLKKYNLAGKAIGQVAIDDAFLDIQVNGQMIKDYIVALRSNARQWSACTKTRAEVAHTTKKPHAQKGTGRARQGTLVAPQHRGGGRAHGPKPKFDQNIRVNKKERRAAIHFLIAEIIRENRLAVLDSMEMDAPKTKEVAKFVNAAGFNGRTIFLTDSEESSRQGNSQFRLSARNIPNVEVMAAGQVNGYDLLRARSIVLTEAGLKEIIQWLS